MGNWLGISASSSTLPSPPPRRPASPSTQASGTATTCSVASSSPTSSPASLLSTNSSSQEGGYDEAAHVRTAFMENTKSTTTTLSTTIAPPAASKNAATAITTANTSTGKMRFRNTQADQYYERYQKIPLPKILHDNLKRLMQSVESKDDADNGGKKNGINGANELDITALTIGSNSNILTQNNINSTDATNTINNSTSNKSNTRRSKRILVIGDVHGCITELHTLVQKATHQHNSGVAFAAIIVVGDLCNKGPHSTAVIRHVRTQPNWFSIRGNNEDRALTYALSQWDEKDATIKHKYKWIAYGEDPLSDEDVEWMANLPYTITIPKTMFGSFYHDDDDEYDDEEETNLDSSSSGVTNDDVDDIRTTTATMKRQRQRLHDDDIIIVHAGLDSRIPNLENQNINTMINIRDVQLRMTDEVTTSNYNDDENKLTIAEDANGGSSNNNNNSNKLDNGDKKQVQEEETTKKTERTAWAKLWHGPQLVIFGHDARRGLQTEKYAIGLDSGCCYGRELTGIILPEGEYVSVEATKVHCPFKKKKK